MPTIDELKEQGYTVRVQHLRFAADYDGKPFLGEYMTAHHIRGWGYRFSPKGGKTVVTLYRDCNKNSGLIGIAKCNIKDHYDKRFGVKLAIARALGDTATEKKLIDSAFGVTEAVSE